MESNHDERRGPTRSRHVLKKQILGFLLLGLWVASAPAQVLPQVALDEAATLRDAALEDPLQHAFLLFLRDAW